MIFIYRHSIMADSITRKLCRCRYSGKPGSSETAR
jgi:hypothetical protein